MDLRLAQRFESFAKDFLSNYGITVISINSPGADLVVRSTSGATAVVETKLYKSTNVPVRTIRKTAEKLSTVIRTNNATAGILVASINVDQATKSALREKFQVLVYDYDFLFSYSAALPRLQAELIEIVREAAPFRSQPLPLAGTTFIDNGLTIPINDPPSPPIEPLTTPSEDLWQRLARTVAGRDAAGDFASAAGEALRYIFDDDLTAWKQESGTHSNLHRF